MSTEIKENDDSTSPKKLALKLRQQGRNVISPIDLSAEMAEPLNALELQWLNFYEPPNKLMLRNSGDTVMIQGRWPHQRPTLSGGPLDDLYVFNQVHFHWDSPIHEHKRHTINNKPHCLEMHALFYKSGYKSMAEAQEKEDGVLIVAYFFKIENRSSFKWMTDQLEDVKSAKTISLLPPAPLCSLMVPFTKDYLVYWGALPCTCHHVLWMVSRTTLRITRQELAKFATLQSYSREKMHKKVPETVEPTGKTYYQINSSNENEELLFPYAVDPPCQITTRPDKISIAVAYQLENTKNITAKNTLNREFKLETRHGDLVQDSSTSASNGNSSNTQHLCSVCRISAAHADHIRRSRHRSPRKRIIFKKENIANNKKIKLLEKERNKYHKKAKHLYLERKKSATARRLFEEERRNMLLMKEAFNEELKKLRLSKEQELKVTTPIGDSSVAKCSPQQFKSPINKSVLTKKPNSVFGSLNNLKKKESLETNNKSFSKMDSRLQSGTTKDNGPGKEEKDNKEKVESAKTKSKLPVLKFTPYRPQGLQSTLTPYFQSTKSKQDSENRPQTTDNNVKITKQIPKCNKGNVSRTAKQDLRGKGDHSVHNPRRTKINVVDHILVTGINFL